MFMCLCNVKMACRILQVKGRVLSCQSKPNDNKWLQKKYVILFVHEPLRFFYFSSNNFIMAIARFLFCTLAFSLLVK